MKKTSIFVLTVFISCILSVSAFASSSNLLSVPVVSSWTSAGGVSIGSSYNTDVRASSTGSDVFCFGVQNGGNAITQFVAVTSNSSSFGSTVWAGFNSSKPSSISLTRSYSIDSVDQGLRYNFYGWSWSNFTPSSDFPMFNSLDAGLQAFLSDPEPDVPLYSYVDIPAGYVAVLKGRNPSDYSAATFRTSFSWSSSPNQPYWGNTGHSYKFFDSRPTFTGSTLFPLSGSTSFNWLKMGSFGPNGSTKGAYYDISFGNTYHWIVIYNPFYTFDSSSSNPNYNSSVRCYAQLAEVYLYPVAQLLDSDGWTGRSLQDWENPYVGVAPEGTSGDGLFSGSEPWTFVQDSTTDPGTTVPAVPQPGGDNEAPVQVTLPEILLKFGDFLTGFFDNLLSLFGKGEEAILALIGIAAPFFSMIGLIFTWLPAEITAFLTAAITATVFLGFLKHFL